jgi:hypothetical protein
MPIYVVGGRNQRVHIANQAVSVSITGAVRDAELDVRAGAEQPVVRSNAHHAVLPRVTGPVTVAVRPVDAPRFRPGTVIHLVIAHDDPGEIDPVQVLFDPVDVSGDSGVVFAALRPIGSQIELNVSAVADAPLSPLGSAARSSARKVIGRGPAQSAEPVVLAVDTSASMRPWFMDDSVAAAADVVVGVASALGMGSVSAVLVGTEATPVALGPDAVADSAGLAQAVRDAKPRWSAGARWSRLMAAPHTIVCVDEPTAAVRQRFPVITLSGDPRFDAVGARLPPPRIGQDASAELLAHPAVLDRIAAALVRALT